MSGASSSARPPAISAIVEGTSGDPFAVLGRHDITLNSQPAVVFRTLQPGAVGVELVTKSGVWPMTRLEGGLFEVVLPADSGNSLSREYSFRIRDGHKTREVHDPYRFGQLLA